LLADAGSANDPWPVYQEGRKTSSSQRAHGFCFEAGGGELSGPQRAVNRALSALRALVEHPFRVIKRQFGYNKVRYRGLAKNTAQIVTLFALSNLWQARGRLLAQTAPVRP
jgi:hypothetical protein